MNKSIYFFLLISIFFISCGGAKRSSSVTSRNAKKTTRTTKKTSPNKKANNIINYAKTFQGTKYKYGGTTKKGMDCSGLIYTSFKKGEITLPRTSSHVGLVVSAGNQIRFIHSSSSKGVTISSLDERYWNNAFAWARRVL